MATKKKTNTTPAKGKKTAAPKAAQNKTTTAKTAPAKTETSKAEQPKAAAAKPATAKAATGDKPKLSLIKAAIAVLEESDEALNTKQMIEKAKAKGLWTPGEGKTPEQTLYSAIAREIKAKGENSRFKLVAKGHFKLASR